MVPRVILAIAMLASLCLARTGAAQTTLHTFDGQASGDSFGVAVANAGDVDADGVADQIVGSRYHLVNGQPAGNARVFSGRDGGLLREFPGNGYAQWFGLSVAGLGDLDGDGHADVAVGAPHDDQGGTDSGSVFVYSGATGLELYEWSGSWPGGWYGFSVATAGDVNLDGKPDVIIGAWRDGVNGFNSGLVEIRSGLDGTVLRTYRGDTPVDEMGYSVACAGDVNGDGTADQIAGILDEDISALDAGSARVWSGVDGSELYTFNGDSSFDWFGHSVSGLGDLNGDGFAEVIVGAPQDDNQGSGSGMARVYSGVDGSTMYTVDGGFSQENAGFCVSETGDVDGDTIPDFGVGAPWGAGKVRIYSGATGLPIHVLTGSTSSQYGYFLDAAGDVNQNGGPELVVGAPFDKTIGNNAGRAFLVTFHCGAVESYATGCPGQGGIVPQMNATGCPTPLGSFVLSVTGARGPSSGLLFLGTARDVAPLLPAGCPLNVAPLLIPDTIALPLSGTGPGSGAIELSIAVPPLAMPALVTLQTLVLDPDAPAGYASTNAIEIRIE